MDGVYAKFVREGIKGFGEVLQTTCSYFVVVVVVVALYIFKPFAFFSPF